MRQAIAKDPKAQGVRCRLAFELLPESPFAATDVISEMSAAGLEEVAIRVTDSDLWNNPTTAARTLGFCKNLLIRFKEDPEATWNSSGPISYLP